MTEYDFSTINDKEFEVLCRDLLNAKHKLELQAFKSGQDKGIDLRYSTPDNNNSIVVQAKHYLRSGYSQLKSKLKTEELGKIKKLSPDRYIVVTSLPLSASEKDELKKILFPYVLDANDIIGREDLNAILGEHPEIEKKHFKLWVSSITILERILNNAIEGRSGFHLESLKKKISLYVVTEKLNEAIEILTEEKLLLITGQPGIGKTTLADMLLLEKAKNEFRIYKVETIREAEDVFSIDPEAKQLFFLDDFLGSIYLDILTSIERETQFTSFVERIRNTPNKYLVLTTRTVILNQAQENYEKIKHTRIGDQQFELRLTDYTRYEKAKILYNHLFFNEVNEDLHNSILNQKFYQKIITHENYIPRIIEFITDKTRINSYSPQEYLDFIMDKLNNPQDIWRSSFENQINEADRWLLLTLFSFTKSTSEPHLIKSYESRLGYEKEVHNQPIKSNQFVKSVRILLNGFISSTMHIQKRNGRVFTFINPSLSDFLIGYVAESFQERKAIISSLSYVDQLYRFQSTLTGIPLERELQTILLHKIVNEELDFVDGQERQITNNMRYGTFLEILVKYCTDIDTDNYLVGFFERIDFSKEGTGMIRDKLLFVLLKLGDAPITKEYVKLNFDIIITALMQSILTNDDVDKIPLLFNIYEQDYDEFINSSEGFEKLYEMVETILRIIEEELEKERSGQIMDLYDVDKLYEELNAVEQELKEILFPNYPVDIEFGIEPDYGIWEDKIKENLYQYAREEMKSERYYESGRAEMLEHKSEQEAIDDLFQ